ncbi:Filamin-A [Eufriesea mexicana]|uniref:Filamin-A n=1 Tax=Eufriesea mexicana TaxID=516756 RepID=A0A310SA52_9HYME|nr:Filamin-A [Eufriesea mexicana]
MCENDKSVKCENAEEEDDDMFEQDFLEDAQWKRTQQNTFTRWANEKLKTVNRHIDDLECDLSDGLHLIGLIEVLAQKKLPKHSQRPIFRSQKLENVSVALKFLDDEGIRIVNIENDDTIPFTDAISDLNMYSGSAKFLNPAPQRVTPALNIQDSSDIVDCKLKLILGLIWTLILHYSISMPMWEGEDSDGTAKSETPKQRLIRWIHSKVPELPITNFTTDWNDGRAVGALVDAVATGLCPDWKDWNKNDAIQNASEAMQLADDWLNLIKPEEMVNPNIDEMSMMTYLSQYPSAKLKPGAPLRPRTNRNRRTGSREPMSLMFRMEVVERTRVSQGSYGSVLLDLPKIGLRKNRELAKYDWLFLTKDVPLVRESVTLEKGKVPPKNNDSGGNPLLQGGVPGVHPRAGDPIGRLLPLARA